MGPALLLGAYLLGSIPSGLLLARLAGIDVRHSGSGNIGATNVARTAGARLGVATLVADVLKGAIPVLVATRLGAGTLVAAGAGLSAFLGHVFPITLGFAGGKGVATALGAFLALCPTAVPAMVAVFLLTLALTGYVSVASMAAAVIAPMAIWLLSYPPQTVGAAVLMSSMVLLRHRSNLSRLGAGTEPPFSLPKKQAAP